MAFALPEPDPSLDLAAASGLRRQVFGFLPYWEVSGASIRSIAASISSAALCGGIEVAMPTAMPCEPLASRLGNAPGRTIGSDSLPS